MAQAAWEAQQWLAEEARHEAAEARRELESIIRPQLARKHAERICKDARYLQELICGSNIALWLQERHDHAHLLRKLSGRLDTVYLRWKQRLIRIEAERLAREEVDALSDEQVRRMVEWGEA